MDQVLDKKLIVSINENLEFPKGLSVSKVLGYLTPEFDKEGVAQKTFDKHFNDSSSKYYQKTKEEILEMWEEKTNYARNLGSLLDSYSEYLFDSKEGLDSWKLDHDFDNFQELQNICHGLDDFKHMMDDHKILSIGTEIPIKCQFGNRSINGRIDRLFYAQDLEAYLIVDWKTNENITEKNPWSYLLGPMKSYQNTNRILYTLQTQFYKAALNKTYNIPIDSISTRVVHLFRNPVTDYGDVKKFYEILKDKIPYDYDLLSSIVDFAYKKNEIEKNQEKLL